MIIYRQEKVSDMTPKVSDPAKKVSNLTEKVTEQAHESNQAEQKK